MLKTNNLTKRMWALTLALVMILSTFGNLVEVRAEEVTAPTIKTVFYGATEITGAGVHRARVGGKAVRGTIHVTLKNGDTTKASSVISPTTTSWKYKLPDGISVAEGDVVTAYQEFNGSNSATVTANAEPSLAYSHKDDLKMPSGDFYLEQFSSNIVSDDEKAEALQMLRGANPSFANDITSIMFEITGIEDSKVAHYTVTYKDRSKSEDKIPAPNMKIVRVTEHSRKYTLEPYNVVSTTIKGKLNGEGPFNDIKVEFSSRLGESDKPKFCEGGSCTVDKNSESFKTIDVDPKTGEFSIDVGENTLKIGDVIGIKVKEPHKFATCNSSTTKMVIPKVDVKDPKKLKLEEKEKIADAIRKANTTHGGVSKLPDGNEYTGGIPAVIQIDDSGNVKIFSGSDVKGDWGDNYKFVPETNEDGSYKLKDGAESKITFNKPEELLANLAPDAPKMENKNGNVVITPNFEVDTDAKQVVVEYEGADGSKQKITATKTDTGWTVDNNKAKVDENGVVNFPTKEIKSETTVNAYVVDNGGLVPEEKSLDSTKAELKIENKYKVTYDSNGGEGTMPAEEVNVGTKHRIKDNGFTAPKDKEFDHWIIGFEPKNSGEDVEVNNDIVIKAIWKYIINPSANEVETIVGHPVSYKMYKDAIKDFPAELTVEHIKVVTPPDISKVGGTKAIIEVRFSDGQFRTVPVTVNVKPDPKDEQIKELNKKIDGLNKDIAEKDTKITELNDKIVELEKQLKTCQEQCAADKAQCEKDKQALQEQINTLAKEKSNLEIQVKENRELIEQLRSQIADLKQQVEDWKKIAGEKDAKIKELENNIKELNTKLETANNANKELTEKLATATEKIASLEKQIETLKSENTELKNKIAELEGKLDGKETEIKTLNGTVATLKEKIAALEAEKTKDKEAYEKDKAELEKQLKETKETLATKEKELGDVKTELEQIKNDLSAEKSKASSLAEQVKAKDEKITDLNKEIEELKAQLAKAKEGNTTAVEKYEKTIKEKETIIETLKTEKTELEKQLAAEKAKNTELEKQITDLNTKVDKAAEDLKTANEKITELEKQLSAEQEKNKNLTDQLNKITTDLENKTKEVEGLNKTVTELKGQLAKITAEQAKDKEACEKAKAALQEKLDKANADLTSKNDELDKIKAELEQAKKDLAGEKAKTAGLTEKTKAQEEKITGLEGQLKALQDKLNKAAEDLKTANDRILELEKQLTEKETENKNLTEQVEKLGKDLETKTAEANKLNEKIIELEKQISEKTAQGVADKAEIERLKSELEDLKNKLQTKSDEADKLSKEIATLKEAIKALEGEKTELTNNVTRLEKEVAELNKTIEASNNKIAEIEKANSDLKEENSSLKEKVANLEKQVADAQNREAELNSKIASLNEQIAKITADKDKEISDLNGNLADLQSEKSKLEGELLGKDALIEELRNQIAELKKLVNDKDSALAGLREKITELENNINSLTTENQKLKEDLNNANSKIADLEKELGLEKSKNETLEKDKAGLEKDKADLQEALNKSEEDKAKLQGEKNALEEELNKLKEDLSKCPADLSDRVKELEGKIAEQEKLIAEKDKEIADKDATNSLLKSQLEEADKKIKELDSKVKELKERPTEREYWYPRDLYYKRDRFDDRYYSNGRLEAENNSLLSKNKDLQNEINVLKQKTEAKNTSYKDREKYVTIFALNSTLYKSYIGEEFITQAEMTDFKGFITPFIQSDRTMLPIRYVALSLGLDVEWNQKTRTATFINDGKNNVLSQGKVTINADTLEMKDQYGNIIKVDSNPILKEGRFYVSITNIIKAFGGTNGTTADGVKNTIEWDQTNKKVLVYKYVK